MMKAVVYKTPGEPQVLEIEQRPKPIVKDNEILIKVKAAGVNRPDIIQRRGYYPAPPGAVQDVLGLEVSGTIEAIGHNVKQWSPSDEICALVPGGGYSEYVAIDAGSCLPIPRTISLEDSAALPEVLFTVWHNVFQRGRLVPGETVLIYGASGGIGSMAIQLVSLFGAKALAVVGSKEKGDYCLSLGATQVINYREEKIDESLESNSVDLILDCVGGEYLSANLGVLKEEGRLVYINAMQGGHPELDIKKVMRKRLTITGSTLRARSYTFKEELAKDILNRGYKLLENPKFKSMVNYKFPLEKVVKAHQLMESRDFLGKIILVNE